MFIRYFLISVIWLSFVCSVYAQDSTFTIEVLFQIDPPDSTRGQLIIVDHLDDNGIKEIIVLFIFSSGGCLYIYNNGEITSISEPVQASYFKPPIVCDFNIDGTPDVTFDTFPPHYLNICYGPDYNLDLQERDCYGTNRVYWGGDRYMANNQKVPLFVNYDLHNHYYEDEDSIVEESWDFAQIWQGTWFDGRPERVTEICRPFSFVMRENEDNITEFFAAGYNDYELLIEGEGSGEYLETYFQIFTSYNRNFTEPDSSVLRRFNSDEEDDWGRLHHRYGLSYNSAVEDFDNDGRLDWAVPIWEKTGEDTFNIHLNIYDPEDFSLISEYVEEIDHIYLPGDRPPAPALGVAAVDYNGDGVYELLLAIQDRPLRLIDFESMELIMSSDFVLPDIFSLDFDIGRCTDEHRLQVMLMDERGIFTFYNLPGSWQIPNSVPDLDRELPCEFTLFAAYPNPFNSIINLRYNLEKNSFVSLRIFDFSGREVTKLLNQAQSAGRYQTVWNANGVPSGEYIFLMEADGKKQVTKTALIR
ncbi:T9SS type A sorting domain-containing protein [bacterium]|nr:T9SS type A sorting domain-containing protein [bacterium]